MYGKTTEDLNGSSDDLIPPRMPDNAFGYAQLQLGADEVNTTGHTPYSVVFSGSPGKAKKKNYQIMAVILVILFALLCIVFVSLYVTKSNELRDEERSQKMSNYCITPGCIDAASFMQSAMDPTADPCENFYQYACGGWIAKHPIPEKQSRWGVDSVLVNENLYALRHSLEESERTRTKSAKEDDAEQKARHFYKACMGTGDIKKLGGKPLKDLLRRFNDAVGNKGRDVNTILREKLVLLNRNYSTNAFFSTSVEVDARNSSRYAIQITQASLGLAQTHYDANTTSKVISAYVNYMTDIHMLLGATDKKATKQLMEDLFKFEKSLAKILVPRENFTDIDKAYHKMTIGQFQKLCTMIDWVSFYGDMSTGLLKISKDTEIIVLAKPYLEKLSDLILKTAPRVLFSYIQWRVISTFAPYLSDDFRDARKELDIALSGSHLEQPRWKMCVAQTDSAVGFAIGSFFVKQRFKGESKKMAAEMVEELRSSFIRSLPSVGWLDDETRKAAKEKALAVFPKIGYPEKIMDPNKLNKMYSGVQFSESNYFQNILNFKKWRKTENIKQLPKAVDKTMWYMTPATVNAYYDATRNQIVFPAGILQPPYYDTRYPMSVNYGGIGAVIGHELLHGFDNSGRLFDKNGNSGKLWWTPYAVKEFTKREKCFIEEYGKYTVKGKHINGKVTLGENIADNGGLKAAYNAYQEWVKKNGQESILPGVNRPNDQVFFISFGQSWCTSARTAALWQQLDTDTHSPAMDRVLGSISNSQEFAKAFKCQPGSKYNPGMKCEMW